MSYSSREVVRLCPDVSFRQLQWWDEQGLVTPERGPRRLYTESHLFEIRLTSELRRKKVTFRVIRLVLHRLRKGRYPQPVVGNHRRYLIVDPARGDIQLEDDPATVCRVVASVPRPVVLVEMPTIKSEVQ